MVTTTEKREQVILEIVRKHLGPAWQAAEVDENAELHSLGMDSMKSISMLLDLEGAFKLTFPDDILIPENYRTLKTLRAMVSSALAKSAM